MDSRLDDLLTTPHPRITAPSDLIPPARYGDADYPVHKSGLRAWIACPRAFELRMVRGLGPQNQAHFTTGRFYHQIMAAAVESGHAATPHHIYQLAHNRTPAHELITLNAGALRHAWMLCQHWAGRCPGVAEVAWVTQIGPCWFSGSWDYLPPIGEDGVPYIVDWKTSSVPAQHEADHGPEACIYRLAYESIHGILPHLTFERLSHAWEPTARKARRTIARGPIEPEARDNVFRLIREIRELASSRRHVSADCHKCPVSSLCMKPNNLLPEKPCKDQTTSLAHQARSPLPQ